MSQVHRVERWRCERRRRREAPGRRGGRCSHENLGGPRRGCRFVGALDKGRRAPSGLANLPPGGEQRFPPSGEPTQTGRPAQIPEAADQLRRIAHNTKQKQDRQRDALGSRHSLDSQHTEATTGPEMGIDLLVLRLERSLRQRDR